MKSVGQHVSQPISKDTRGKVQDKKWSSLCRGVNRKVTSKYNTPYGTYGVWTFHRTKRRALMGLRIASKHTNSFVRLWEILMCHISLKFQDEIFFLKLRKLTHEWCVQRNKALGKNRFKSKISIKIFGYSVKFDVRKKRGEINEFYKNVMLHWAIHTVILDVSSGWLKAADMHERNGSTSGQLRRHSGDVTHWKFRVNFRVFSDICDPKCPIPMVLSRPPLSRSGVHSISKIYTLYSLSW